MKNLFLILTIIYSFLSGSDTIQTTNNTKCQLQEFNTYDQENVQPQVRQFIDLIKSDNRECLAEIIHYPLYRKSPIPQINTKSEFLEYYDTLFDSEFIKTVIDSDIEYDWGSMGWRGIMFKLGDIWLDYDGDLIAINHMTDKEQKYLDILTKQDKTTVHPSLKTFDRRVLLLQTDKFLIRIDLLHDKSFRYSAWDIKSTLDTKPEIILSSGKRIFYGSGGNNCYIFKNNNFKYEVCEWVIGTSETPPYSLIIYKNDTVILDLDARLY